MLKYPPVPTRKLWSQNCDMNRTVNFMNSSTPNSSHFIVVRQFLETWPVAVYFTYCLIDHLFELYNWYSLQMMRFYTFTSFFKYVTTGMGNFPSRKITTSARNLGYMAPSCFHSCLNFGWNFRHNNKMASVTLTPPSPLQPHLTFCSPHPSPLRCRQSGREDEGKERRATGPDEKAHCT